MQSRFRRDVTSHNDHTLRTCPFGSRALARSAHPSTVYEIADPLPLLQIQPLVASVSCALVSILTSLGGGWIVQHSRIPLHISWVWRGIAAGLGASVIATCLAWLLTAQMRQKHAALQKLNKELRNGLQILSYVCSQCEPEVAEQARAAVTRISSANAKASEQLGHQYRSTAWHSGNRRQVVA
jgi:hypothetical protein